MSALGGIVALRDTPLDERDVRKMSEALSIHGPDAQGYWASGQAAFVHRLMRITPEDDYEQQPLVAQDGRIVLLADARIDNREELAHRFGWDTRDSEGLPDSRFVLEAYCRWGDRCGAEMIGDYVIAIWDAQRRSLMLIRDALGARGFHYYCNGQFFAFATMPKGLFALPWVPRVLNETKLADFLVLNHRDHRTTFYRDIYRSAPATVLTVSSAGIREHEYWKPDLSRRIRLGSDAEYEEAFREALAQAVRPCLRCRTPVGAFMSGGMDSSSVAVTAALQLQSSGQSLAVFTHAPRPGFDGLMLPGRYADETSRVREIAQRYDNINLNLVYPSEQQSLLADSDDYFSFVELPFRNPTNRLWMEAILDAQRQQGIKAVLTGQHGNFTISWNGTRSLADRFRRGHLLWFWREVGAISRSSGLSRGLVAAQNLLPLWPPVGRIMRLLRRRQFGDIWRANSAIQSAFARQHQIVQRGREVGFDFHYTQPVDTRRARWNLLVGIDYAADNMAGWKARYGVELRSPTSDRRLAEFCLALPEDQYLRHGVTRSLIRRAYRERLPASVLDNNLRGLQSPDWHELLCRERDALALEVMHLREHPLASRCLDVARLERLFLHWPRDGWHQPDIFRNYHLLLTRSLMVGRFIRWFDQGQTGTP